MSDTSRPIAVVHPAVLRVQPARARTLVPYLVRIATPVRLAHPSPDAFAEVGRVRLRGRSRPTPIHFGPSGLWERVVDPGLCPVAPESLIAWLEGRQVSAGDAEALDDVFSGTPVAAYGRGTEIDMAYHDHAFRGHDDGAGEERGHLVVRDGRDAAAAWLPGWIEGEVAICAGAVMRRVGAYGTWRIRYDERLMVDDRRRDVGLDVLAVTPLTWDAVAALHLRERGKPPEAPDPDWLALAPHWPEDPHADLRRLMNLQAWRLSIRLLARLERVRTVAPYHDDRVALENHSVWMGPVAERSWLGLAGSVGFEGDGDVFRSAVALEAAFAGRSGHRTGIDHLAAYIATVLGPRIDRGRAEDEAALSWLVEDHAP